MKAKQIHITRLPDIANRTEWAKALGLPTAKLVYEQNMGRLTPAKQFKGFNVFYTREEIISRSKTLGINVLTNGNVHKS